MNDQLERLWGVCFSDPPEAIQDFFSTAYSPERCRYLERNGQVVSALYWLDGEYQEQKVAYLYAVATAPDFRGMGLCRKLIAKTHQDLARAGYASALLSPAGEGLRRMYAGMGYRDCCFRREFSCRAGKSVALQEVSVTEYAALRRQMLPPEGLVQEGPTLSFLSTYARFYAGEDFLLAASVQDSSVQGWELLGNSSAAAGIVSALNADQGKFRAPGREVPVGMILPLTENAAIPGYLGFPLD